MVIEVTDAPRITENTGGQPKQTYWTPDGRKIRMMPDMHEFVKTDRTGKIIESGVRDANYDKGWLPIKPSELKLYCSNCDRWHDTTEEISDCERSRKTFITKSIQKAKREITGTDNERITKLEVDISEIKSLLQQLIRR